MQSKARTDRLGRPIGERALAVVALPVRAVAARWRFGRAYRVSHASTLPTVGADSGHIHGEDGCNGCDRGTGTPVGHAWEARMQSIKTASPDIERWLTPRCGTTR